MGELLRRRVMISPSEWDYEWEYTEGSPTKKGFTYAHFGGQQYKAELREDGYYLGANNGIISRIYNATLQSNIAANNNVGVIEAVVNMPLYSGPSTINFAFIGISNGSKGIRCYFRTASNTRQIYLGNTSSIGNGTVLKNGWDYDRDYTVRIELNDTIGRIYLDGTLIKDNIEVSTIYYGKYVEATAQNGNQDYGFLLKSFKCKYSS